MKLTRTLVIFTLTIFSFSILYSQDSLESIVTWELDDDDQFRCSNYNRGGSDLNNDGYDDYIHWETSDYPDYKFQFFMGKEVPDTTYDFEIEAPFGSGYISWGGDLNRDGYNDIVYGVCTYYGDAGDLYICLGSDSIDLEPELILNGEDYAPDSYHLGFEKGFNGGYDFNGDGYDDILAGGSGPSYWFNGQVDLFFGGEEIDTIPDFHIQGATLDEFGKHKTVGDINGDGYDDLITSRNCDSGLHKYEIYLGGPDMDTVMDYEIPGEFWDERLFSNGDINDDGYDDLVIPGYGIYFGKPDGEITLDVILYYGSFYCNINDDDYSDIVAKLNSENSTYIYYGSDNFDSEPDIILQACGSECNLGDFNGDGKDEIVVNNGEPLNSATMYGLYGGNDIDNNEEEIVDPKIINTFPNPFKNNTEIHFSIKNSNNIQLDIYNIKGQKVRSILNDKMEGGNHVLEWDGTDDKGHCLGSGVYFIKLKTEQDVNVAKMVKIGN